MIAFSEAELRAVAETAVRMRVLDTPAQRRVLSRVVDVMVRKYLTADWELHAAIDRGLFFGKVVVEVLKILLARELQTAMDEREQSEVH